MDFHSTPNTEPKKTALTLDQAMAVIHKESHYSHITPEALELLKEAHETVDKAVTDLRIARKIEKAPEKEEAHVP
jgi:hypothetical protein